MVVVAKGCQLLNAPSYARSQLPVEIVNLCVIHASHFVFRLSHDSAQNKLTWTFRSGCSSNLERRTDSSYSKINSRYFFDFCQMQGFV